MRKQLIIAIARNPLCPACGCDYTDDWHHSLNGQIGLTATGSNRCEGCGKFYSFSVYIDGEVHSTMWRKSP